MAPADTGKDLFTVRYDDGVYVPELDLWLDPLSPRPKAFVSHINPNHPCQHEKVLCSTESVELIQAVHGPRTGGLNPLRFGKKYSWRREYELSILPSGHLLGSAQLYVRRCRDGASFLYTGDFKLRPGLSTEPLVPARADLLIMEATFGLPHFNFPPPEEVVREITRFCEETLSEGGTPVLVGFSLGKAEEVLGSLAEAGIPVMLHQSMHASMAVYGGYRSEGSVPFQPLDLAACEGHVVVVPPQVVQSPIIRRVCRRRVAMLTGWAPQSGAKYRYQVDAVFPLSDHADYQDLMRYVAMVSPSSVITVHGYAAEFARDLTAQGIKSWSLLRDDQMDLPLEREKETPPPVSRLACARVPSKFADFVDICERIGGSVSRTKKVETLSRYFLTLSEANLQRAVVFVAGEVIPRQGRVGEAPQNSRVEWTLLRKALLQVSGVTEARFQEITGPREDAGRATMLALQGCSRPRGTSLLEVETFAGKVMETRKPLARVQLLAERLRYLHPLEAKVLVRILVGDLCIGLDEDLVIDAIGLAFHQPAEDVRRAQILCGDLAWTVLLAKRNQLDTAALEPFVAIPFMMTRPESSIGAVWRRLARGCEAWSTPGSAVWLEDNYEGIRVQLHKAGERAVLFSQELASLENVFPDIPLQAVENLENDVIIDGVLIATSDGRRLRSSDLQKRQGRKGIETDLFSGDVEPLRFVVFDLLWADGHSLVDYPLHERRRLLESLELPEPFQCSVLRQAAGTREVDIRLRWALNRGNSGLVAKDPHACYRLGRRGRSWLTIEGYTETPEMRVSSVPSLAVSGSR